MHEAFGPFLAFWAYFASAIAFCAVFVLIYTRLTPHREFDLIVQQHNASAALAFGLTLIGYAIALAGVLHISTSIGEFVIWALTALMAQLIGFVLARFVHPNLSAAIEQNTMAAAFWLGSVSIATGLLTAASMSP